MYPVKDADVLREGAAKVSHQDPIIHCLVQSLPVINCGVRLGHAHQNTLRGEEGEEEDKGSKVGEKGEGEKGRGG